ncbi:MAG TPA: hypothetical protein VI028_06890 [Solirubrobacterales bacterium]
MARLVRIVGLALCVGAFSSPPSASGLDLSVSGNRLVDESGQAIRLLGVSLIKNYRGKPTGFGVGFRDHLLKLRRHARR